MSLKKNRDINYTLDDVSEILSEVYDFQEAQARLRINEFLVTDTSELEIYRRESILNRERLRKSLRADSREMSVIFNKVLERAGEVVDLKDVKFKERQEQLSMALSESALRIYDKSVNGIVRISRTRPLREAIFRETQTGIDKAIPVRVGNRNYGYKEYMEMSVRTALATEIGAQQLAIGADNGVVFYICNSFADCADDHADFQGRIYYDERWRTFSLQSDIKKRIGDFISEKKLLSLQAVRERKPYLTTRPNCRHRVMPISVDQALGVGAQTLLRDMRLERGTYREGKSDVVAEQRYNERAIRRYKNRVKQNEILREKMPSKEIDAVIKKDRTLMRKWEAEQREHVKNNPDLERDYRRETRNKIFTDLGISSQRG